MLDQRTRNLILFAVVALVLAVNMWLHFGSIIDDAFISFRYAEHFAAGKGLVFNPGERVEGYSNFLWTLGLGLGRMLGLSVVNLAIAWGILSLLAAAFLAYKLAMTITDRNYVAAGVAAMVMTNFSLVFFAISGMETVFFSFLLTFATWLFARNGNRSSIGLAVTGLAIALTRPEGVLYFGLFVFGDVWAHRRLYGKTIASCGLFAVGYAAFLSWRYWYYGFLVPNTYYAKVTSELLLSNSVMDELYRFFVGTGGSIMMLAAAGVLLSASARKAVYPLLPALVGALLFLVLSAGDWMPLYRFLAPVVPVYAILSVYGLLVIVRKVIPERENLLITLAVLLLVVFNLGPSVQFYQDREEYPEFVMTSKDMVSAANWVRQHYPQHYTIDCWRIGALAYITNMRLIDNGWGLTDTHVARLRHKGLWGDQEKDNYRRKTKPELIMHKTNAGEYGDSGGIGYRRVKIFPQGNSQVWVLYQREDLPMPKL